MVPAERMAAVAVGHGRRAARCIDGWLRNAPAGPEPVVELASYDVINPWYYNDAPRTVRPQLEEIRRQTTFEEVVQGLDESSSALFRRCLSCGNCFSCDNCFRASVRTTPSSSPAPSGAPTRSSLGELLQGLRGLCVRKDAHAGAIEMVPEES